MENIKVSSIDKLNRQIEMLNKSEFKEKTKTIKIKKEVVNRKTIQEEATITDINLFDSLMPDFENKTKVFAAKDLSSTINLSFISKVKNFFMDYLDTNKNDKIVEDFVCGGLITLILAMILFIFAI